MVHCNAGISRSTTLVLAYIMTVEKKTVDEALAQIQVIRSGIYFKYFCIFLVAKPNIGFMSQLREFEKELKNSSKNKPKSKIRQFFNNVK